MHACGPVIDNNTYVYMYILVFDKLFYDVTTLSDNVIPLLLYFGQFFSEMLDEFVLRRLWTDFCPHVQHCVENTYQYLQHEQTAQPRTGNNKPEVQNQVPHSSSRTSVSGLRLKRTETPQSYPAHYAVTTPHTPSDLWPFLLVPWTGLCRASSTHRHSCSG